MSVGHARSPRIATWLLAVALPRTVEGLSAIGDLIEEYCLRPRGLRRWAWFWMATLDLVVRYLPVKFSSGAHSVIHDLACTLRVARRRPGLTVATMATLSLAIGTVTAAFSVANGTWVRGLLAADPSVVSIWRMRANGSSRAWPAAELLALRARVSRLTMEGAIRHTRAIGATSDRASEAPVLFVTGRYLETFAAGAALGRLLTSADDEPGAAPVVVLDHLYWRRQLAGDPAVLGRALWVGGAPVTVVGIVGRDFIDPSLEAPALWMPLSLLTSGASGAAIPQALPSLLMLGRLKPEVTTRQADEELTSLLSGLAGPSGGAAPAIGADSGPVAGPDVVDGYRRLILGGGAVVALVLILACANVSNLQVAGAVARSHEVAIRYSCGASRMRVVRQLATEGVAVGVVSGALGGLVAWLAAPAMAVGMGMPHADVEVDLRTSAFATLLTLTTSVGIALAPALHGSRGGQVSYGPSIRSRAHHGRTMAFLLGAQAAASIAIVGLSALFVRSMTHIAWIGPGYDVDRLLNISVPFPTGEAGRARAAAFWPVALDRVRATPGVEAASLAFAPPFGISQGDPDDVFANPTDEAYFDTIGLRIVAGRSYTAGEVAASAPVMVISEEVARRFWPDRSPVGALAAPIDRRYAGYVVIGVVADAMALRVYSRGAAALYLPGGRPESRMLTVRASDPRMVLAPLRDVLRTTLPGVQPSVAIVGERFSRELAGPRRRARLAAVVAALTLVISMVGLAGVTMFSVQSRVREVGLRLALGARRGEVLALLLRDGLRAVIVGLAVGLGGALIAGQYVSSLLYGMSAHDPLALLGTMAAFVLAAACTVLIPVRRAAATDPAAVLREG